MIDLYSRRLLGAATGLHPDAELTCEAIKMAVGPRRRRAHQPRHLLHRPRLDLHRRQVHRPVPTAGHPPVDGPGRLVLRQRRRGGVLFQPAWGVLSRHEFTSIAQAHPTVVDWAYGFDNHQRRHSPAAGQSPVNYETAIHREAA